MKHTIQRHTLSRRRFLQLIGATGAIGLTGGAIGYGAEHAHMAAPFPNASGRVVLPADARPEPGAPLLLVINHRIRDSFGFYLGAILRAEGLNAFRTARLDALDPATLDPFATVILSAGPLEANDIELLEDYVRRGGNLIAMRPDPRLGPLLGVQFLGSTTTSGYLGTIPDHPVSQGIATQTLQFHGSADHVRPLSAEVIAQLYSDAATATNLPLITLNRVGKGRAAAWTFDLARSIALTRQGNPAWANQDRDNIEGVRATDLFTGWIDLERIAIPQADEQQRLFANLLHDLSSEHSPLPRLWYFPGLAQTVLVTTGDAHGSEASFIEDVLGRVEQYGGHMSIYYTPRPISVPRRMLRKMQWQAADAPLIGSMFAQGWALPTPKDIANWRARGHEFGMHPYIEAGLVEGYNSYWNDFVKLGYGPVPPTVRTHRILWNGWVENARVQAQYGIRMNLDHYHVGETVRKANGEWGYGYLTGSGLPLQFVDEQGNLLSVYQQQTHLVDEHLMNVFDTGQDVGLSGEQALAVTTPVIADSLRRYPAALGLQCHIDSFTFGDQRAEEIGRWFNGMLDYVAGYSVPILSAERWLAFTEARAATTIERLTWDRSQGRLSFELAGQADAGLPMELMAPLQHGAQHLRQIQIDGADVAHEERTVGGVRFATVQITAGSHAIQSFYTT
jgi:hypothetical protein